MDVNMIHLPHQPFTFMRVTFESGELKVEGYIGGAAGYDDGGSIKKIWVGSVSPPRTNCAKKYANAFPLAPGMFLAVAMLLS
jgi:hypothetical protein